MGAEADFFDLDWEPLVALLQALTIPKAIVTAMVVTTRRHFFVKRLLLRDFLFVIVNRASYYSYSQT